MSNAKLAKKIKKKNDDMIRKSLKREKELRKLECWMQNSSFGMLNFISVPEDTSTMYMDDPLDDMDFIDFQFLCELDDLFAI